MPKLCISLQSPGYFGKTVVDLLCFFEEMVINQRGLMLLKEKKVQNGPSTAFFLNFAYMVLSVVMAFIFFFQWQMLRINHGFCTQNLKQLS